MNELKELVADLRSLSKRNALTTADIHSVAADILEAQQAKIDQLQKALAKQKDPYAGDDKW